eukprot:CAMPEP_0170188372 /NCGR_PEP_ID=MMETSP0040_2-20121228/44159_1 /TAXON_ID=641309 /ORGANISM="Lotharella oceanica, Strain CCMP622" /LENGTH=142 /DNA_ID=CAMNT_0010435657 /DNA_START=298 /DNA_END=726 /DNA_ORIENTATION=-
MPLLRREVGDPTCTREKVALVPFATRLIFLSKLTGVLLDEFPFFTDDVPWFIDDDFNDDKCVELFAVPYFIPVLKSRYPAAIAPTTTTPNATEIAIRGQDRSSPLLSPSLPSPQPKVDAADELTKAQTSFIPSPDPPRSFRM